MDEAAKRFTRAFHNVEVVMRKHRKVETDEERNERYKRGAQMKIEEAEAADDALDAKIARNIKAYGP